jgi:YD repeat-containing protein
MTELSWNEPGKGDVMGAAARPLLTGVQKTVIANGVATTLRTSTTSYDADGRAVSTAGPAGLDAFAVTAAVPGMSATVTDPLGTARTTSYVKIGGLTRTTYASQPAGAGSDATAATFAYDAQGNLESAIAPDGVQTCYANDPQRQLELVRIEGLVDPAAQAMGGCAPLLAQSKPLPLGTRRITTAWHPDWRLPIARAEPRHITRWVFNHQPDPMNPGSFAVCAPDDAKLPSGKPIAVLCARYELSTIDATGAAGLDGFPLTTVETRYTYDKQGRPLTRYESGRTTTNTYYADATADHQPGDRASLTDAMGRVTRFTRYDGNGQVLETVDPYGRATTVQYDLAGRPIVVTVIPRDGGAPQTTTLSYFRDTRSPASIVASDGTTRRFTYDDAARLLSTTDAEGNTITYTRDSGGNVTKEETRDAAGLLWSAKIASYDALGRLQSISGGVL